MRNPSSTLRVERKFTENCHFTFTKAIKLQSVSLNDNVKELVPVSWLESTKAHG